MTASQRSVATGGTIAAWVIALVATYAWFVGAPGWNQNSRFALTRAIVEHRTFAIDPYQATTGDKSWREGHYYCDKAPGASWLAVPGYALVWGVRRLGGGELPEVTVRPLDPRDQAAGRAPDPADRRPGDRLRYNAAHRLALYLSTLLSAGVIGTLAALALYRVVRRDYDAPPALARAVAVTAAVATPALAYTTSLYGHATCGAALVIAYAALTEPGGGRRSACILGAAAGAAVAIEYPAAPIAALLWIVGARRHGRAFAAWSAAVAGGWALALAGYHQAAFGSPWATGYDFLVEPEFAEGMRVRYGLGWPDPAAALQLTFGTWRGLYYVAPILLPATWGLAVDLRSHHAARRGHARIALAVALYYWLLASGYYMWDGGAAIGPRHMVPMIGLLSLGLVRAWRTVPLVTTVLAVLSALQMAIVASVGPEAPSWGNPIWEYAWGHVWTPDDGQDASNLGRWLGLPGLVSLLPLVAVWWWALARPADDDADQNRPDSERPAVDPV